MTSRFFASLFSLQKNRSLEGLTLTSEASLSSRVLFCPYLHWLPVTCFPPLSSFLALFISSSLALLIRLPLSSHWLARPGLRDMCLPPPSPPPSSSITPHPSPHPLTLPSHSPQKSVHLDKTLSKTEMIVNVHGAPRIVQHKRGTRVCTRTCAHFDKR